MYIDTRQQENAENDNAVLSSKLLFFSDNKALTYKYRQAASIRI